MPFKILVAYFSKIAHRLIKNQFVETVLPKPTKVIATHITFGDVVGVNYNAKDTPERTNPKRNKWMKKPTNV